MKMRLLLVTFVLTASVMFAQLAGPVVSQAVVRDVSPPFYDLALQAVSVRQTYETPKPVKQKHGPLAELFTAQPAAYTAPPSLTTFQTGASSVSPQVAVNLGLGWEGLGSGFPGFVVGWAPPDTTMAAGPNHVVQFINLHVAIFNKAGEALLPQPGFVPGNSYFAGMGAGTHCDEENNGDPMVQYDRLADRWIITQFQINTQPYEQCVAVSTTNNPLGSYYRYAFQYANHGNDYPKLGIWPNAYFLTYNMFLDFNTFEGAWSCAMNRAAMLSGSPAMQICFTGLNHSIVPGDMDGPQSPPTNSNYQIRYSTAGPVLNMFKFTPDFVPPANSTFINNANLPVPGTLTACNNQGFAACIPQPSPGELLDTLADRMMYRFAYSNRSGAEALVITHSVDPDGAGPIQSALRLYEIRTPATTPTIFQNITYMPDAHNRWMGSAAMDKLGNIAAGYSISSSTKYPSIGITGRTRSEIRNRLQAETIVKNGTGAQFSTAHRWGDYSAMQVDPADGCTFWYTTEYYTVNSSFNWRTFIQSFKFPNCQ